MALTDNFEAAAETKKIADKLEKAETQAAQLRAQTAMEVAADELLRRQKLELEIRDGKTTRKLQTLEARRKLRTAPFEKNLERILDELKVTKGQTLCPQRSKNATYRTLMFRPESSPPGSFEKMHEFRASGTASRLELVPLDSTGVFTARTKAASVAPTRKKLSVI
jgi:hypothetical protein